MIVKRKSESGLTAIDAAVAVTVIFIFTSIIASLVYQVDSKAKEIELKGRATNIAVNEIESIKGDGIDPYLGRSVANGNSVLKDNEPVNNYNGFTESVTIEDYSDINNQKRSDVVKKVTVTINYTSKGKEQSVKLSTLVSKQV